MTVSNCLGWRGPTLDSGSEMPPGGTWAKPREKSEEQLIQTGQETAASAKALWQEALGGHCAVTRGWKARIL